MSSQHFKEVVHIYKQYKSYQQGLDKDYNDAAASGNFNRGYLNKLKDENAAKMAKYQQTTTNRLDQIRAEYEKEINLKDYLSGMSLPDHLLRVLNSPIQMTERDYTALARKFADNNTASRALHDHAAAHGFTLDNYKSPVEKMAALDCLIDRCKKSMWEYGNGIPYYLDDDSVATDAGKLAAQASVLSFECFRTPQGLEEMIEHDMQTELGKRNQISDAQGAAFVEGFTGQPVKDEDGNILTEAEQLDAMIHSLFDGRGGVVSPADVNYIRTDSDYQTLREQNPINDSDLGRMRDAVSSAIHERSRALSRGQDTDAANACALDAFSAVMGA
jgi:hypothetical protein